jgi:hypothetical protein
MIKKGIVILILLITTLNSWSQKDAQAKLVLPFKFDFYYVQSIISENGKFALLTGMTSTDQGVNSPSSLLINLELKKIIKEIPDANMHLSKDEGHQLQDEYFRMTLSNNGRILACRTLYKNEIHLISLDQNKHEIIQFSDGDEFDMQNCLLKFNQNDSKLFFNSDKNKTYIIDPLTALVTDSITNDYHVLQISVDTHYLYQAEIKNDTNIIIKKYSQNDLSEIVDKAPGTFPYFNYGRCLPIFSNHMYIQAAQKMQEDKLLITMYDVKKKQKYTQDIILKKISKDFDAIHLIDACYDDSRHSVFLMTITNLKSGDELCDIWKYHLKTKELTRMNEFRFTAAVNECDGNGFCLTRDNELFFLNEGAFYSPDENETMPTWYNPANKEYHQGYGNGSSLTIGSIYQQGSHTLFEAPIYGVADLAFYYTEINLANGLLKSFIKTGETMDSTSSPYSHYENGYHRFEPYNDSINKNYFPLDSINHEVVIAVKNKNKHIVHNVTKEEVNFFNFNKEYPERKVNLLLTMDGEYIFYTDDRYYLISSNASNFLYFEKDIELYPFEQFDLKYNRPDIILDRLGYADSSLIDAYHSAYQKRLKKMGFTKDMLQDDFHLPEIKIENYEELPVIHDQGSIELNLKLQDTKSKLDRINVWVNDVAVYGINGISLRDKNVQDYSTTLSVNLAKGKNKVQVSVLNQAGAESYKETFEIECSIGKSTPDLYLITIGVSEFQQPDFNLTYATKDAKDMSTLFEKSKAYKNVYSKTLLNQDVTKENVLALKSFLTKAGINDEVMIFIAGHGVLDTNLDYYLATFDMDFQQPQNRGLAYDDLENLLDGIKPLKKTLIIDACHSGEIDKEEIELAQSDVNEGDDIQFRAIGNTVTPKLGIQNTSELVKSLFTDLRKGSGATVISSAGGMEFAMEGDDWGNGLFTYCLIKGIKTKEADLNNDGEIWLSEIQKYVAKQVTELSGGRQQPTSRIENQTVDFRIW